MGVRRLILVRHVASTWSEQGILQGHQDPPLSQDGVVMLPKVLQLVKHVSTDSDVRVASSDLRRASGTALHLSTGLGSREILFDQSLREVSFGDWEGRPEADLDQDPVLKAAYDRLDPRLTWPGARNSLGHTFAQAVEFVDRWSLGNTGITAVVSHGIILQGILSRIFFGDFDHAAQFDVPAGGVSAVDVNEDFDLRLVRLLGAEPAIVGD